MAKGRPGAIACLLGAAASLAGASSASAATEVGNDCAATAGVQGVAFVQLAEAPGNPLPFAVPAPGVLTKWRVTKEQHTLEPFEAKLKVYRATDVPNQLEVVGGSALETLEEGPNSFDARIPVQAGDRLGLYGTTPSGAMNCMTSSAQDVIGVSVGDVPPGSAQVFSVEKSSSRVAVSALVEPDADHDGFGDETQDRCPQSASLHDAVCPRISLSSFALGGRVSAQLLVAADAIVPVTASGTVRLPGRAKKRTGTSTQLRLSPVTQTVAPGQIAQFTLPFPKPLLSALRKLPRGRSLQLSLEAGATDLAGAVTTTGGTVRLRGQARPHR
jgi:hypothetical protein